MNQLLNILKLKSLRSKVNLFILSLIIISFIVFSLTFVLSEKNRLSQEIINNGQVFANFSTRTIYENFVKYYTHNTKEDFDNFKTNIESVLNNNKDVVGISLVAINGKILFDSDEFQNGMYEGPDRIIKDTETLKMINDSVISHKEIIENDDQLTEIISPLDQTDEHLFSVRYVLSHKSLSDSMKEVYFQILSVIIPLLFFVFILTRFFVKRLVKPIDILIEATKRIRGGDLDFKTDITSGDEIGQLGVDFNEMTKKLKESYTILEAKVKEKTLELENEKGSLERKVSERTVELEEAKAELEKRVEERTHNLNEKLLEFEKLNELMAGRELKIIELKKEIDEFKKRLSTVG